MVQTTSLFSQLLHEFPGNEFARLVNKHHGERHAKGFTCWVQYRCSSLPCCSVSLPMPTRSVRSANGFACCLGRVVHLGINRGPTKSTLSYANVHRSAAVLEDLFWTMTNRCRAQREPARCAHVMI